MNRAIPAHSELSLSNYYLFCNNLSTSGPGCGKVEKLKPYIFKEYANKHNINLCLGVGATFLDSASPAEIEARVKNYLQVGAPGGRLTLYLCALSAATPPENVRAAVDAVHKYGTYKKIKEIKM